VFNRGGGGFGVTGWWSRHLGASLGYSATWTSGIVDHQLTLDVMSRLR